MFLNIAEGFEDKLGQMEIWKKVCYFLKETNIPTDILVQSLNSFYQAENPKENFNLIGKAREWRTSSKIYKVKRIGFNRILEDIGLKFDYFKMFFPHECHTIQDINGLCDKSILWPDIWQLQKKLKKLAAVLILA